MKHKNPKSKDTNFQENQFPPIDSSQLNEMQLFAYNLIKYFIEKNEQLLMIINGAGGTGKSFTIAAISFLLANHVKRSAPTAKAAFLIKGETLHSQFRIHCNSKGESYIPLSGAQLSSYQDDFKGIKIPIKIKIKISLFYLFLNS